MGAPKGNKNGVATQFKPLVVNELTVMVGARLPVSELKRVEEAVAASGQTKADWVREAIMEKLSRIA
jgi:hypothetical protein